MIVNALQENKISLWSIGEEISGMEAEFEGDPQLLCECKHGGDVLDLNVRWLPGVEKIMITLDRYITFHYRPSLFHKNEYKQLTSI
jgi:hypothetical protein